MGRGRRLGWAWSAAARSPAVSLCGRRSRSSGALRWWWPVAPK
uniref:Uncharacterized protein n=1 Tax=Arundo donax TaxID=35708 RepID=A0A0A9C3W7_ARUDO